MGILRRILDFYIQSSIHVALSVYCLILITEIVLGLLPNPYVSGFGFFGTIVGYNFVKYDALARSDSYRKGKPQLGLRMKFFIAVSFLAFVGAVFCFLKLTLLTQLVSGVCMLITALYTLPFFPNRTNARSWSGLKIYIVALCWVGVTVVLPVLDSGMAFNTDFYIVSVKRFILVVVLLFIFEIIDLAWDDPHLRTVPQQIGIKNTKRLGIALLIVFLFMELFQLNENANRFSVSIALILVAALFLGYANPKRSRYYTSFWAESIPVLWWVLLLVFG